LQAVTSTDPKTYAMFEKALKTYQLGTFDGIGLALRKENGLVGLDLDSCRDPDTGAFAPWALRIVQRVRTYWEISTSGTGLRGFGKGRKPGGRCRTGDFELYSHGRYLCITGHHLDGTPTTIEPVQEAIDAIYTEMFPAQERQTSNNGDSPHGEDEAIIAHLKRMVNRAKFCRLFDDGDISDYSGDHSAADQGLCRLIAFRTQEPEQIDRIFRLSALSRQKWESREDYRDQTIAKAITHVRDRYQGASAESNGQPEGEGRTPEDGDDQESKSPLTLVEVVAAFRHWLHMPHLIGALYVLLGTYAANRMSGDPLWLMLVGGSGWGKTELLMSIMRLPHVHLASTLTEASLLSGTSQREKGKESTGGVLRKIGGFGCLLCKDFTSILSMNRESSTAMLAALREIFDGEWIRHVGVDGGRTLGWKGKLAFIAGCTGAIDRFHAVVGALGERFVSFRLKDLDATQQGTQALQLVGQEAAMRKELSESVSRLFSSVTLPEKAMPLNKDETTSLVALASLAALCRSPVIRDHTGEIELILDQEAPSRLVMCLSRLYTGMQAIGVSHEEARPLIHKVALDCMPALRRDVFDQLINNDDRWKTQELATTLGYPYNTTKRTLEDLTAHGVVCRHRNGKADEWTISDAAFQLFQTAKQVFLPDLTREYE
jgi:NrS-1  polymerase HBD domain